MAERLGYSRTRVYFKRCILGLRFYILRSAHGSPTTPQTYGTSAAKTFSILTFTGQDLNFTFAGLHFDLPQSFCKEMLDAWPEIPVHTGLSVEILESLDINSDNMAPEDIEPGMDFGVLSVRRRRDPRCHRQHVPQRGKPPVPIVDGWLLISPWCTHCNHPSIWRIWRIWRMCNPASWRRKWRTRRSRKNKDSVRGMAGHLRLSSLKR